ncbi:MAG: hypothetical protein ACHQUC_00930 [Chlamydiales bacterium]
MDENGLKWTVHLCPSLSIFVHNSHAQHDVHHWRTGRVLIGWMI